MKIMQPNHPGWEEFCERLNGPEGIDYKQGNNGKWTWKCSGGEDKSFATAILKTMPEIDVEASLKYFEKNGGHCDCEILLNVF